MITSQVPSPRVVCSHLIMHVDVSLRDYSLLNTTSSSMIYRNSYNQSLDVFDYPFSFRTKVTKSISDRLSVKFSIIYEPSSPTRTGCSMRDCAVVLANLEARVVAPKCDTCIVMAIVAIVAIVSL